MNLTSYQQNCSFKFTWPHSQTLSLYKIQSKWQYLCIVFSCYIILHIQYQQYSNVEFVVDASRAIESYVLSAMIPQP